MIKTLSNLEIFNIKLLKTKLSFIENFKSSWINNLFGNSQVFLVCEFIYILICSKVYEQNQINYKQTSSVCLI